MKLLTETPPTQEALTVTLKDEKAISNHLKKTNNFKSFHAVNNITVINNQNLSKLEPKLAVDRENSCINMQEILLRDTLPFVRWRT